jgi:hypothetical protein
MENKDMTGVLFPVENKKTDKHPNLTGNVIIKARSIIYRLGVMLLKVGKNTLA